MDKGRVFYGWWIVIGCTLIMAATCGIAMNSIPVAYKPIASTFGFKMGEVSMITSLMALSAMLAALVVGKLMSKINVRLLTTVCGLLYCVGLTSYAFCSNLVHFYAASVIIGIGAAGTYLIPISVIITNWFNEKRGLALAIAFAGTGVGGIIFGPLMNYMITIVGVSKTFLLVGAISAILILPVTLFLLRLTPVEMGLLPYGNQEELLNGAEELTTNGLTLGQASKTLSFWLLAIAIIFWSSATIGIQMHIPSYFTHIGYSAAFAAGIFAAVNGILMLGKLVIGLVADKFGTKTSIYYIFIIGLLAIFTLNFVNIKLVAYLFAGLAGLAAAIMTIPLALWTAEILGKKDFAMIYSLMNVCLTLGVACGPPITGFIFDANNSYLPSIYLWIGVLALSMVIALIAYGRRPQF